MSGTRLILPFADKDGASMRVEVAQNFNTVLNQVDPMNPPTSQLEHRTNCQYTNRETGAQFFIPPAHVLAFEEIIDEA